MHPTGNVGRSVRSGMAERVLVGAEAALGALARTAMALMLVLILVQVFTRYVLNDALPVVGITEVYLMPIIVFFSLSRVEAMNAHIRVDLLYGRLTARAQRWLDAAIMLAGAVFWGLVAWYGTDEMKTAYARDYLTSGEFAWPLWMALLVVPVGAGLFTLRLLLGFAQRAAGGPEHDA